MTTSARARTHMTDTRHAILHIRVRADEKKAFQQAADLAGIALTPYIRERLRRVVRTELEAEGYDVPFMRKTTASI